VRNYRLIRQRWSQLVKKLPSVNLSVFGESSGYPLMLLESSKNPQNAPSFYLSAGIHGDEPAGVEGLLQWAEESLPYFTDWNFQIFPCLNPWGLERNVRCDEEGRDLNRCYNEKKIPQIIAQTAAMKTWQYDVAVTLHEDYDARGFYLYEIASIRPTWGESLRDELALLMPSDTRCRIDGRLAKEGVIRRRITPKFLKELRGYPEALYLDAHHARRIYTFETPSEDFLARRIEIHKNFVEIVLRSALHSEPSLKQST
jgi:hypothetical protein